MKYLKLFELFELSEYESDAIHHKRTIKDLFQGIIDDYGLEKRRSERETNGLYYNIFDIGEEYTTIYLNIFLLGSFLIPKNYFTSEPMDQFRKDIEEFSKRLENIGYIIRRVYNTYDHVQIEIDFSKL